MPCNSGGWPDEVYTNKREIQKYQNLEACLCGVLTSLEDEVLVNLILNKVDWGEVGVSREWLESWWEDHKKQDQIRRTREQQKQDEDRRREVALAKLTPDERALLRL